jgi:hypothetical protein
MLSRAVAIWLLLLVVAVFNGALRERLITPRFGEQGSHIVSTAILAAAIFLVAWISVSWIGPKNGLDALVIGIVWVALTVGNSWERLIADYNVFSGRIWILVLAANLLAPLWAFSQKQPL